MIDHSGNVELKNTVKKALDFFEQNGWERVPLSDILRYSQQVLFYVQQVLHVSIVSSVSNHTLLWIRLTVRSIVSRFLLSIQRIHLRFLSASFVSFLHGRTRCNTIVSSSPSSLSSSSDDSTLLHSDRSCTNHIASSHTI